MAWSWEVLVGKLDWRELGVGIPARVGWGAGVRTGARGAGAPAWPAWRMKAPWLGPRGLVIMSAACLAVMRIGFSSPGAWLAALGRMSVPWKRPGGVGAVESAWGGGLDSEDPSVPRRPASFLIRMACSEYFMGGV